MKKIPLPPVLEERCLEQLELFGLTRLQARVYVASYVLGETTVRQIVDCCRLHKVEVYRLLTELERLGAVDRIIAHPARYRARRPEEVLKILLLPQVKRLAELGEIKAEILERLHTLNGNGPDGEKEDGFEILRDRLVLRRAAEMFDRARESICYIAREYEDKLEPGFLDAFNRAVGRGVRAKGVLRVTKRSVGLLNRLNHNRRISRRHSDRVYSWMVIIDGAEAIFGSAAIVLPGEEFLYTRNPRFVAHLVRSFEILYEDAVPIEERLREIGGSQRPVTHLAP